MSNSNNPLLRIENLSKHFRSHWRYRRIEALRDVTFEISEGEIFGYLGQNGAGKTTTFKCILGLLSKNEGEIFFEGKPLRKARDRKKIGFLPELPYFYDHLTVGETISFFSNLSGVLIKREEQRAILEKVGVLFKEKAKVRTLSKGLQQRLALAQAIVHRPKLLLLDEPFSGLDPLGRREFREIFLELKKQGTTIILSSHILSDIEHLSDRVSIMANGRIQCILNLSELPKLFGETFELLFQGDEETDAFLRKMKENKVGEWSLSERLENSNSSHLYRMTFPSSHDAQKILREIFAKGYFVQQFQALSPKLEDVFLKVTCEGQTGKILGEIR